jgi:hypothetical protein
MSAALHADASRVHRYAVRRDPRAGWTLTRDGRPIGSFESHDEARSVAEKITTDIARAGVLVEFADYARGGR